jgi:hypothetical protein
MYEDTVKALRNAPNYNGGKRGVDENGKILSTRVVV